MAVVAIVTVIAAATMATTVAMVVEKTTAAITLVGGIDNNQLNVVPGHFSAIVLSVFRG